MCKNAGGRVFLRAVDKENRIKIKFQLENILENYVIFEVDNQYYAILAEYYAASNSYKFNNTISLHSLFDKKYKSSSWGETDFVAINFLSNNIKILADKVLGVTMLAPKRLTGTLAETKHIIGMSQFGDRGVLLLDLEAIMRF